MGIFDNIFGNKKPTTTTLSDLSQGELAKHEMQIIEKHTGARTMQEFNERYQMFKEQKVDHNLLSAYSNIYTQISQKRKQMFEEIYKIRSFWLADSMIDQIAEDALAPDTATGEILEVTSQKPEIKKEIEMLNEQYNFDKIVEIICPDMIALGDYFLSTEVIPNPDKSNHKDVKKQENLSEAAKEKQEKKEYGLVDLRDDITQYEVVPITHFAEVDGYLQATENNSASSVATLEPADYIMFSIDNRKVRIDLKEQYFDGFSNLKVNKEMQNMPKFIRVGKSVLYPALGKFKELELMEQLVPATKINKLSNGTLIGVQFPSGFDVNKAMDGVKTVEGVINKQIGIDTSKDEMSLTNILNNAGSVKCVPIFGDKGQLQKLDYQSDEPDDLLGSVEDIRRVICTSVGIPYEIMFSSDDSSRAETLKRYARYLRLLKNIQKSLTKGIQQIVMIHLANKGISFVRSDIEVQFRNKLIEIDSLDKLEFLDSSVQMMSNIKDFIFDLAEEDSPIAEAIDLGVFLEFMEKQFSMVGLSGLIDAKKAKSLVKGKVLPDDGVATAGGPQVPSPSQQLQGAEGGEPEVPQ